MPKCEKKWGSCGSCLIIIILFKKNKREKKVHCFSLDETTLLYYVFHADRDMHSVDTFWAWVSYELSVGSVCMQGDAFLHMFSCMEDVWVLRKETQKLWFWG